MARDEETGLAEGEKCAATETEGHYILVVVTDEYTPFFPALSMGRKLANGNYQVRAEAGMRTK